MPARPAKRVLDVAIAGLLLMLSSPVFAFVFVAYLGRPFYQEPRVSAGRTFGLLKFRTLRKDVLARAAGHARLLEADPTNLTWLGRRILKPWYLDEIPQLVNVLRGEISLVGPRPWPPELVAQQRAEGISYRDEVPAGLTGLAQLSKGSDQLYADLDVAYIERSRTLGSWALVRYDLEILLGTLRVIARGQGLSY